MTNEIYEITYTTEGGEGIIRLDCDSPEFEDTLRVVEQTLADTHAKNIVYTKRLRRADDFPADDFKAEQLSFLTE